MPSTVVDKFISFEDFEKLPETFYRQELFNGVLIELPPPKKTHNETAERIRDLFKNIVAQLTGLALGKVHHEMGYRVARNSWIIPDVSITHANQTVENDYYIGYPAVAVEVISNEKTIDYIEEKLGGYLAAGCLVFVVYPAQRHIWKYAPNGTYAIYGVQDSLDLFGVTFSARQFFED